MHSNYILSPELKDQIRAVPSSSEFWTEHADLVAEHHQSDVKSCFQNSLELAWEMKSYSTGLIRRINGLLEWERNQYPSWLLWWMLDRLWNTKSNQVDCFTRKIQTNLNDIALATGHFFTDDLLYHPETRVWIDFRDYGFETELEFIMSMSAYGISEVRSWGMSHKAKRFLSASWYEIEVSSDDYHDPCIILRDQSAWNVLSPFWNIVNFKPEVIDWWFQFSQQTEPEILGSLFSYVASQTNIQEKFWENGEKLRELFWYRAHEFLLNESSLNSFIRNAFTPIQGIGNDTEFRLDLEHRIDGHIFLVNQNNELEFRKCTGTDISENVRFTLHLDDAIKMIESMLFLINKQSTFRTMPKTWYAFVTKYFHELWK